MDSKKKEERFQFIKDSFAINAKVKQPLKFDKRKIKRKAPANHPWRQYKTPVGSEAI